MNTRDKDNGFEVRLGRIRSASGHQRVTGFLKSVGGRAQPKRSVGKRGQRSAQQMFSRRVIVKVSIVKMEGRGAGAQRLHLKYIARDSAAPGDEPGGLYDRSGHEIDSDVFEKDGHGDRHQFRVIVSPEDASQMRDLTAFTRDLMSEVEKDLGTKLEWVAANHYNTGQPHTHIVIRGKCDDGADLVMPRKYVSHGIRERAQELVQTELGPVPQIEGRNRFAAMVRQARVTELDRNMMRRMENGIVDVRAPVKYRPLWRAQLERARLKHLSKMGLAQPLRKGRWQLAGHAGETLKRMGERGDIIKTMHRAMETHGLRRIDASSFYDPSADNARPITGRIISRGIGDDVSDRAFIVLDTMEGKPAYVDIGSSGRLSEFAAGQIVTVTPPRREARPSDHTIEKIASKNNGRYGPTFHMQDDPKARPEFVQTHVRRLEALRRAGHATRHKDGSWAIPADYLERAADYERISALSRPVVIEASSSLSLSEMKTAIGVTWLDTRLMADETIWQPQGFGADVGAAIKARRQFLAREGFLEVASDNVTERTLAELTRRDLAEGGGTLSSQIGKPYMPAPESGRISGTLKQSINRPSGRFAVVERAKDFTLVPWRDVLERAQGKSVTGLIRGNTVSWRFGKTRGVS